VFALIKQINSLDLKIIIQTTFNKMKLHEISNVRFNLSLFSFLLIKNQSSLFLDLIS